jgi:hypothetical protein
MPTTTSIAPKSTPTRETSCAYCGATDEPMRGKDLRVIGARTWRLASACVDDRACTQRARQRDQHLDEVWALTEAGRALALELVGEQLHLQAAS